MTDDIETRDSETSPTQYLEILLRRRWVMLATALWVFAGCTLYAFLARPVFQANVLLEIEKPGNSSMMTQGVIIEEEDDAYIETQYRLMKSNTLDQKVYDDLDLNKFDDFSSPRGLVKLQNAITVTPVPRTRLAYVQVESHDPGLAVKVANTLTRDYVEQNLNNQLFMSRDVLEALQIDKKGINPRKMYEALPSVVDNKLIQTIKEEKISLEAQIADLSQHFTAGHPQLQAARSRLRMLDSILESEVNNIILSLKTTLSGQLMGNNVRVVDPAQMPEFPSRPKKLLVLVLGLLGGLVAGFFAALVMEIIDQSVRTQEDVERKLNQSFLGVIPFGPSKAGAKIYGPLLAKELSLTSEAFRNLRTMVDFTHLPDEKNSLLVTSSLQEEGKSYVSANLAVAFAQLGEKVLLIDGDLRRPRLHKSFGLSSERGLSEFLAGGTAAEEAARYVQKTEIGNLHVMPCGPRPPNPSELLNTPRLGALVAWVRKQYDRVLVDCTPMFPISDTLLWGRHVRSAIFVARFGVTRAPLVRNSCAKLQRGGVKTLGIVINQAKVGDLTYAPYGKSHHQYYFRNYADKETKNG